MTSDYTKDVLPGDQTWDSRPLEYWGIDLEMFEPRYVASSNPYNLQTLKKIDVGLESRSY